MGSIKESIGKSIYYTIAQIKKKALILYKSQNIYQTHVKKPYAHLFLQKLGKSEIIYIEREFNLLKLASLS